MVQTYLVHHGYCATAEAFANSTGIGIEEDLGSIRSRQSEWSGTVRELSVAVVGVILQPAPQAVFVEFVVQPVFEKMTFYPQAAW